jgi:hypothetical protein
VTPREQLIAYLATLGALVAIFIAALAIGAISETVVGKIEMFGLGTITGGLIGVLRIPSARQMAVGSTESGDVNVKESS